MLILLILKSLPLCLSAGLKVHVPDSPVVALFGTDMVLNCSFSGVNSFNQSQLSVFWQLADTQQSVHSYSEGTSLFSDQLALGNASLLLRSVRVADEGTYTCFVRVEAYDKASIAMQVAAPYSKPLVTWEADNPKPGDVVELTCLAFGGYPEADVLWQDGSGNNLTENVTVSPVANEQGLFTIQSVLTVILEPSNTYSCRLTNPLLGDEGNASVTITAQGSSFPPVALWVTVGLAVCLLVLLVALAAVCHRKIKESCEEIRAVRTNQKHREEKEATPLIISSQR
uniref:CD276 molecule n=1 Tax=Astyanax mexicanus TaxID=7994 RepID=W5KDQ7_ASTMX